MSIADDNVNFRDEASLDSDVILALRAGAVVDVIDHDPAGWSKVKFNGSIGFIRSEFLTISTSAGPVTFKTTDDVNFRSGPSLNSSIITSVDKGSSVEVLEHNPAGWSKVRVNGTAGYIKSEFLALPTQASQASQATQQETGSSARSSMSLATIEGANFRTGPSTDTEIITTVEAGSIVEVLDHDPTGWSKVKINGTVGYIRSDLLGPIASDVELLHWSEVRTILPYKTPIRIIDVRTGIPYTIQCFSKGDHADVEPLTRADTDTILSIRGGVWSWAARPVWVIVGDRIIAGSIHAMPHDVSTIPDNGMNGHVCLHFYGSTTSSTSESYRQDLKNAVMEAYNAAQ